MFSIFNHLPAPYAQNNPEKKYEYALWKYFPGPDEKEKAHLGIIIFDGKHLEAKLREDFSTGSAHLDAEFSRVRDEIKILANHLNGKKEKKLRYMTNAFSREEHFRFGQAKSYYSLKNLEEALCHLFRQYIE